MVERSLVVVVDDDESVREALPDLLKELGFAASAFSSAEDFLASDCVASDALSDSRHHDAGDVRARSATGIDASRASDSDCFHHRAP